MNLFQRLTASVLIASTALLGMPMVAQAGIVSSSEALASSGASDNTASSASEARAKLDALLARDDVRSSLAARGLSADMAQARVQAMTDEEVATLAGRIDQAPAGGDILGLLFTVFLILLVTDILGLTKVYPFTRSVR